MKEATERYFVIQNSENPKLYLKPYPTETSGAYIWNELGVGIAGFYEKQAIEIAENCTPKGKVIPMDSLAKKVYKE